MSHAGLAIELQNVGVVVDESATGRYSSRVYNGWQVKHDGSIHATISHPYQVELSRRRSRSMKRRESVKRAIAIIKETGKVNRSCGFHVHVEASDLNSAQFGRLQHFFNSWKKVLLSYVSASRRNNHFCKPTCSARDRYVSPSISSRLRFAARSNSDSIKPR